MLLLSLFKFVEAVILLLPSGYYYYLLLYCKVSRPTIISIALLRQQSNYYLYFNYILYFKFNINRPVHGTYNNVLNFLNISLLSDRRTLLLSKFLQKLILGLIDCPEILSLIRFKINHHNSRDHLSLLSIIVNFVSYSFQFVTLSFNVL
uniref:Uncharacterized protein n=1 Tax=Schizaphis graminum TaxID=13262 RepID=A0A2S2P070_SCHGA